MAFYILLYIDNVRFSSFFFFDFEQCFSWIIIIISIIIPCKFFAQILTGGLSLYSEW